MNSEKGHGRDLHGLVVRGIGWTLGSQFAIQIVAIVTSIIIARLLGPHEVGLAAEALVFGSLALVVVDFGFSAVIVQRPTLTEADKSTAFWAGTTLGIAMTLLGVGLSWPIAALYGEPEVQPLFATLSLAFLFVAPGIVQGALLNRDLAFRSLEMRTVIATLVSSGVAVALAFSGAGAWAIIGQLLTISLVSTLLLWRASPWRPRLIFRWRSLREMASYTTHTFGTGVLNWATINVDNFVIGRALGPATLGAYAIAFSLMITPLNRIAAPIVRVFFPAFSRMQETDPIGRAWLRAVRMVAVIVTPIMLGLLVVAPDFVSVLFGDDWGAAVPLIELLAPIGLIQSLMALNNGVLQSLDRTQTLFRFTLALSVTTVAAFIIGVNWEAEGVAAAYLGVTLVFQPILLWRTTRAVGISVGDWLNSVRGVLLAGIGMAGIVFATRELLLSIGTGDAVRLGICTVVGAVAFTGLVLLLAPEVKAEITALRQRMKSAEVAEDPA